MSHSTEVGVGLRPRSSRARIGTAAFSMALASAGFTLAGLLRQKLTVILYDTETLAVVGQATLFQNLVITLAGAGLVLGARVLMSDGTNDSEARLAAGSWLFRRPLFAGLALVPIAIALGPVVSTYFTGTDKWAMAFDFAAVGAIGQIAVSSALSSSQILGGAREYLRVATVSVLGVMLATSAVLVMGKLPAVFATFVVSPAITLGVALTLSPAFRRVVRAQPRLPRSARQATGAIAAGSLIHGGASLVSMSVLSSRLARSVSLNEVALLQPVILVSAAMSLVSGSLTSVLMFHHNRQASPDSELRQTGPWDTALAVSAAMMACGVVLLPTLPLGLRLLFDSSLVPGATAAGIQLAVEALVALVWIGGSMLVPAGRIRLWVFIGLVSPAVRLVVGVSLIPSLGATAVPISSLAAVALSAGLQFLLLLPRLSTASVILLATITISVPGTIMTWWDFPRFELQYYLIALACSLVSATTLLRSRIPRGGRPSEHAPNDRHRRV